MLRDGAPVKVLKTNSIPKNLDNIGRPWLKQTVLNRQPATFSLMRTPTTTLSTALASKSAVTPTQTQKCTLVTPVQTTKLSSNPASVTKSSVIPAQIPNTTVPYNLTSDKVSFVELFDIEIDYYINDCNHTYFIYILISIRNISVYIRSEIYL